MIITPRDEFDLFLQIAHDLSIKHTHTHTQFMRANMKYPVATSMMAGVYFYLDVKVVSNFSTKTDRYSRLYDCSTIAHCCPWLERIGKILKADRGGITVEQNRWVAVSIVKEEIPFFLFPEPLLFILRGYIQLATIERDFCSKRKFAGIRVCWLRCAGAILYTLSLVGREFPLFPYPHSTNLLFWGIFLSVGQIFGKAKDEKLTTMSSFDMNIHHLAFGSGSGHSINAALSPMCIL